MAGLTFRTGSQGDRHVDESTEMQAAIGRQWQEIRSRGLFGKTDMYIRTKATRHTNQLRAMFDTPNVSIVSTPSVDDYDEVLLRNLQSNYDGVFFTRPDLLFKDDFMYAVDALRQDAVTFPFVTWDCENELPSHKWRVADTFMYVPKDFILELSIKNGEHDGSFEWRSHSGVEKIPEHIPVRTLIPSHHDSDSQKDWNPLYVMSGREQHALIPPRYGASDCWGKKLDMRKVGRGNFCRWTWC